MFINRIDIKKVPNLNMLVSFIARQKNANRSTNRKTIYKKDDGESLKRQKTKVLILENGEMDIMACIQK